jgi:hypothetical protein
MVDWDKLVIGDTFTMDSENKNYEVVTVTHQVVDVTEKEGQRIVVTKVIA